MSSRRILAGATASAAIMLAITSCRPAPAPNAITIASTGMVYSVSEVRIKAGREVTLHLVNRDVTFTIAVRPDTAPREWKRP